MKKIAITIMLLIANVCCAGYVQTNLTYTNMYGNYYKAVGLSYSNNAGYWYAVYSQSTPAPSLPEPYIWWKMTDQLLTTNILDSASSPANLKLQTPYQSEEALLSKFRPSVVSNEYSYWFRPSLQTETRSMFSDDVPKLDLTNTDFSISLWVYSQTISGYYGTVSKGIYPASCYTFAVYSPDRTQYEFWTHPSFNDVIMADGALTQNNNWILYSVSYNKSASTISAYSNGIVITKDKVISAPSDSSAPFRIGAGWIDNGLSWSGYLCQPYITHSEVASNQWLALATTGTLPTNIPVARWAFTNNSYRYEDSGTNSIASGLRISGAVSNSGSLSFDGINDYCASFIGTNIISNTWTHSFWVYPTNLISAVIYYPIDISDGNGSFSSAEAMHIRVGGIYEGGGFISNSISVAYGDFSAFSQTTNNVLRTTDTNQWHNIILTYNVTNVPNVTIYLDGVPKPLSTTNFVHTQSAIKYIRVGSRGDGFYFWNGSLDDYRIWTTDLTQNQALSIYNNGRE